MAFPIVETFLYPEMIREKFVIPNRMSNAKMHQTAKLWNGPAAMMRARAPLLKLFVPDEENVTNAAGMQTVKEAPAVVIWRASLRFMHYCGELQQKIGFLHSCGCSMTQLMNQLSYENGS